MSAFILFILKFLCPTVGGCMAAYSDIRERRIPNEVSVALLVSGLLFRLTTGGVSGLLDSLLGATVGFAILFLLYAIGGGGAGDVKFMTGVGAWIGPYHIVIVYVLSALILLIYTLGVLTRKSVAGRRQKSTAEGENAWRYRIPYAVPATLAIAMRLAWLLFIGRRV